MSFRCEICGRVLEHLHHCSQRAIARREAQYRREEEAADACEEDAPTFTERLETGLEMLSLVESANP